MGSIRRGEMNVRDSGKKGVENTTTINKSYYVTAPADSAEMLRKCSGLEYQKAPSFDSVFNILFHFSLSFFSSFLRAERSIYRTTESPIIVIVNNNAAVVAVAVLVVVVVLIIMTTSPTPDLSSLSLSPQAQQRLHDTYDYDPPSGNGRNQHYFQTSPPIPAQSQYNPLGLNQSPVKGKPLRSALPTVRSVFFPLSPDLSSC
jgi:hypothetical protein